MNDARVAAVEEGLCAECSTPGDVGRDSKYVCEPVEGAGHRTRQSRGELLAVAPARGAAGGAMVKVGVERVVRAFAMAAVADERGKAAVLGL